MSTTNAVKYRHIHSSSDYSGIPFTEKKNNLIDHYNVTVKNYASETARKIV